MTDRERMVSAYGILWGAANGAQWVKQGGVEHLLISRRTMEAVLDVLYPSAQKTEDDNYGS